MEIFLSKQEQAEEIIKCMTDINYFAEKYCQVLDRHEQKYVPLVLRSHQKEVISEFSKNNLVVLKHTRGEGITTTLCVYLAHYILITPDARIAIVSNKKEIVVDQILNKVTNLITNLPEWLGYKLKENNKNNKIFSNYSEIRVFSATKDGTRGMAPDLLIIDNAAFLEYGYEFWVCSQGALSVGSQMIAVSSINHNKDKFFEPLFQAAKEGKNRFKALEVYNKNLIK